MKNLVIQVDIPGKNKENAMHGYWSNLFTCSKIGFLHYAKNFQADYLCIQSPIYNLHPTYERFQLFDQKFDNYDYILYCDCDIIPRAEAESIFDAYPGVEFAAFSEGSVFYGNNKELNRLYGLNQRMENIIKRRTDKGYIAEEESYLSQNWLENSYFNAGVFLISQSARIKARESGMDKYLKPHALFDQSALNRMVFENNILFTDLSFKYNGLFHFYDNLLKSDIIVKSHFIHFCGPMKNLFDELCKELGNKWYDSPLSQAEVLRVLSNTVLLA